ncbi:hypothetical protein ACWGCW_21895 [Streptomyces sp. NPDC054933]
MNIQSVRQRVRTTTSAAVMGVVGVGMAVYTATATPTLNAAAGRTEPDLADLTVQRLDAARTELFSALLARLPQGTEIRDGDGSTTFTLTRPDGSRSTLSALEGTRTQPEPCPRYGVHCQAVSLSGGSHGWAYTTRDGRVTQIAVRTHEGKVVGLLDTQQPNTSGTPLTTQQLINLASHADVLTALESQLR